MTMQLLPRADMATFPSKCLTCGSPAKPSVVFDVVQDWTGRMILCVECLTDAATKFCDVIPRRIERELYERLADAGDREFRFMAALSNYQTRIKHVSADFLSSLDGIASDSDDSQLVLELPVDSEDSEPEPETGESASEQGPISISSGGSVSEFKEYADTGIRSL